MLGWGTPVRIRMWQTWPKDGSVKLSPCVRVKRATVRSLLLCRHLRLFGDFTWFYLDGWPSYFFVPQFFLGGRAEESLHDQGVLAEGRTIPRFGSFGAHRSWWSSDPGLGEQSPPCTAGLCSPWSHSWQGHVWYRLAGHGFPVRTMVRSEEKPYLPTGNCGQRTGGH